MKYRILVTLTILMVLIFTCWNALRAWTFLAWQDVLTEFSASLQPNVGAVLALFWTLTGSILLAGIWQRKPWSLKMLPWVAAGYTVWIWSERLFLFQQTGLNTVFTIVLNLIWLIFTYFVTKTLSREAYERNIEKPETE